MGAGHQGAGVERPEGRLFQWGDSEAKAHTGFGTVAPSSGGCQGSSYSTFSFPHFRLSQQRLTNSHSSTPSTPCPLFPVAFSAGIQGQREGAEARTCRWGLSGMAGPGHLQGTAPPSSERPRICLHLMPNLLNYTKLSGPVDLGHVRKDGSS